MGNILTELPVVGDAVAVLDKALADAGTTAFVSETVEFAVLVVVLVVVGTFVVGKVVPLLGAALAGPLVALVKALNFMLLLPQLAFTAGGRTPSPRVYAYGVGVERASDAAVEGVRRLPPTLEPLRRFPRKAMLLVVTVLFLLWNWSYCPGSDASCVSPISQWMTDAEAWAKSGT